ncbi:hypothetical protein RI054_02g13340 [Pseudoscourfieldia marina]
MASPRTTLRWWCCLLVFLQTTSRKVAVVGNPTTTTDEGIRTKDLTLLSSPTTFRASRTLARRRRREFRRELFPTNVNYPNCGLEYDENDATHLGGVLGPVNRTAGTYFDEGHRWKDDQLNLPNGNKVNGYDIHTFVRRLYCWTREAFSSPYAPAFGDDREAAAIAERAGARTVVGFHATPDTTTTARVLYYHQPGALTALPASALSKSDESSCSETGSAVSLKQANNDGKVLPPLREMNKPARSHANHFCSLNDVVQSYHLAIAQTLSRESPRYHFKHLDLVEMPLRFHKVPLTRCRRMGIPNAPPHVQAIRNYPDSSRGCARVSIEVMCEVQVFDDNSVQAFDDNSVQAFDDNRDDHLRWVPLEDPVLLAWAYGPRSGVGGIDGTLMEARVEHSREQTQSPTGQFSVRFDTCTAGRHAVHVRLEYLSRNHTIAEQSVPGAHNLHYLPPEIIMRKADGSPYAVDVTLPEAPPMHISPSPSSADNRPACELGLEHAPQWKNPPGSRSPLMSQLRASFRWSDAASTLEEAMQYHTTHSSKTRRFSTVFHMGHTHAVRKTFGNNLEESPSLQQLAADSGLAPYPDGRGGFYKKAYETNNVDAWFTELPRFQPWDRFEAAPSSPCRLCRYDFDDAMKCANKRPMIVIGDSTGNRVMHEMECAVSFGGWEHTKRVLRNADDETRAEYQLLMQQCKGIQDLKSTCRLNDVPKKEYTSRDDALEDYPCLGVMPAFARDDGFKVIYSSIEKFIGLQHRQLGGLLQQGLDHDAIYAKVVKSVRLWHTLLRAVYGHSQGITFVVSAGIHDAVFGHKHHGADEGAYIFAKALYDTFTLSDDKVVYALPNALHPINILVHNCATDDMGRYSYAEGMMRSRHDFLAQDVTSYGHGLDPRLYHGDFWPFPSCFRLYHAKESAERMKDLNDRIHRRLVQLNRERRESGSDQRVVSVVDWREASVLRPDSYVEYDDNHPQAEVVDELIQLVFHGLCGCGDDK